MTLATDIQRPEPGAVIDLFQIDLTRWNAGTFKFYSGVDTDYGPVDFGADTYLPFPITINGLGKGGQGPLPRPGFIVSNITGAISQILPLYDDLVGAKVIRYRTLAKYLNSGSSPDFNAKTVEIYYVERKKVETAEMVEFELASAVDIMDKKIPGRQMIANTCVWQYLSDECGWDNSTAPWYDNNDDQVGSKAEDSCGKRLSSCQTRFGLSVGLPFGGFPSIGRS